ncbi:T9SS type B sorting domain-containing protein [Myroides pelagicus]|uniref:T9SS type B sorting domain-containing protein n=1 Tax=Myroides pelagicus TaxID=270914 RepID=UPI002DB82E02|nr:T9SS type B sorting domain-containing protein [Myroides pelagicus]MEC4112863.1 T9SS type B sorting domain-containing protein [Myroides pelagicus]
MSKNFWLLFFVLSVFTSTPSALAGTKSINYLNKASIAIVADQQQPNQVVFGKPFNVEQCVPGLDANKVVVSDKMVVYLGEALKDKATGSVVDASGNAIVPKGYKYSFHATEAAANAGTNPLTDDRIEIQSPTAGTSSLWLRVYSVINPNDQPNVEEFTLTIKDANCTLSERLVKLQDMYACKDDNGQGTFNLSSLIGELYYGQKTVELFQNGVQITSPLNNFKAVNNTDIEARIKLLNTVEEGSYTFTLYTESLELNPVQASLEVVQSKEDANGRYGIFDLNKAKQQLVVAGDSVGYYTFSFYKTKSDAERAVNVIASPEAYETLDGSFVYVRAESKLTRNSCINVEKMVALKVTEKPYIPELENVSYCDSNVTSFKLSLTEQTIKIADGRTLATEDEIKDPNFDPTGKFTVEFFNSKDDAEKAQNKIVGAEIEVQINEAKQIWVRVTDLMTGSYNTAYFYASIGYSKLKTEVANNRAFNVCQVDNSADGKYYVNLRTTESYFIGKLKSDQYGPSLNPEGAKLTVHYYASEQDVINDVRMDESLVTKYAIPMGGKTPTIYARVGMQKEFDCPLAENYSSFHITLSTVPVTEKYPSENTLQLCADSQTGTITPIILGVTSKDVKNRPLKAIWSKREYDSNNDAYWKTIQSGDQLTYAVTIAGDYMVSVGFQDEPFPGTTSCIITHSWTVKDLINVFVENADATGMVNSLDVNEYGEAEVVIGSKGGLSGNYEFAIDSGAFQMSNRFLNVPIGSHTAWVRDVVSGCMAYTDFTVFGYPKYFTPNGDGYNDTWTIPGLMKHPEARIAIYDRYGKLIKQLSSQGEGWDGTFNGKPMPSTDYWFTVEFTNDVPGQLKDGQKMSYKGHFSLKR